MVTLNAPKVPLSQLQQNFELQTKFLFPLRETQTLAEWFLHFRQMRNTHVGMS